MQKVKHGWLRREIHLAGAVEAIIDYNCRVEYLGLRREAPAPGSEDLSPLTQGLVRVDGVAVGPLRPGWIPWGSGAVRFELKSGADAFPAEVRADLSGLGLIQIRWLALVVAGVTLYEERDGETVVLQARSDLPLPATPAGPTREDLPIAGAAGALE